MLWQIVLVGESDQWHHRLAYAESVHSARDAGLAEAAVSHGREDFGRLHRLHTSRALSLSEDLRLSIVAIDEEQKIRTFLPPRDGLVTGDVVIDDVAAFRHHGDVPEGSA